MDRRDIGEITKRGWFEIVVSLGLIMKGGYFGGKIQPFGMHKMYGCHGFPITIIGEVGSVGVTPNDEKVGMQQWLLLPPEKILNKQEVSSKNVVHSAKYSETI